MLKKLLSIVLWVLSFQLLGYLIGQLTRINIVGWYATLSKSSLNPPNAVFPIVWSVLYIMLAIVGWLIWQRRHEYWAKSAFVIFIIQILMNWLWTPVFFQFHLIRLSFFWLIGIITLTFIIIHLTWKPAKAVALLLIPYFIWLSFASYLVLFIWLNN